MDDFEYKNYRAEQSLMNCGFSPESIASIKSTRVVTHNGTQHVIRNEQSHLFENSAPKTEIKDYPRPSPSTIEQNAVNKMDQNLIQQLTEQQQMQTQQFSRFKQYADNRILQLENQMGQVMERLKVATEIINTLKSNSEASANRARLNQGTTKDPVKEAIDRNGVAPADVSIEKMFYFGNT
ncbi:MAG: hypothetical protein PHU51_05655 [Candidatus Nanoarchaeia archaeon]|nr:hypothetical protein [Candidatus Nanoarchaeia archaeon]